MYENSEHWKGGLMPEDYPEYDVWLKEAKILMGKLKVVK